MKLFPDFDETMEGAAWSIRQGRMTCLDVLNGCLERIEESEPKVRAWVVVDRERALQQAKRLDEELGAKRWRGWLHGIPIGVKDIIDVAGLPTACGSRRWADRVAEADAPLVAKLREAGAIILGKTVTTQYAWIDPPVTRNPWNLDRTPGGSSSGSAAAVACGMCLGAIGSQTGGSIIRPASFCGVVGYKPTYGHVSAEGILPFAPSLDHPGPIARTVADLARLYDTINAKGYAPPDHLPGAGDWTILARAHGLGGGGSNPPTLGVPHEWFDSHIDPAMRSGFDRAWRWLLEAGATLTPVAVPPSFDAVHRCHRTIMASEAAAGHRARFAEVPDDYAPRISELIREGLATPAPDYIDCQAHQRSLSQKIADLFHDRRIDALVTPATIGAAPDQSTTGDPFMNSPWSYTGSPALSIPFGLSRDGLPLALQLIGDHRKEFTLFKTALWCEDVLRKAHGAVED